MQFIENISQIADSYDGFLCDLWGVIHDGDKTYPGVINCLQQISAAGKKLVFISNAPRLAAAVNSRMQQMGINNNLYNQTITSGEAAVKYLQQHPSYNTIYYLGLAKDKPILQHIPQQPTTKLQTAKLLLIGNYEYLGQDFSEVAPILEQAHILQLPALCINPDIEVVKQDGKRISCAGYIASKYEEMGGAVQYIGKPYNLIYEYAMAVMSDIDISKLLVIGDNLHTDIKGGKQAHISTLLITGGILRNQFATHQQIINYCTSQNITPDYIVPSFRW